MAKGSNIFFFNAFFLASLLAFCGCTIRHPHPAYMGICSFDSQFRQADFSIRVNKSKSSVLQLFHQHLEPAGLHQIDDHYQADFHRGGPFAGPDLEKASYHFKLVPGSDSLETTVQINGVICSASAKKYSKDIEAFIREWLK